MTLPTPHSLRAALVVLRITRDRELTLEERSTAYQHVPVGGLYRQQDLEEAEHWLSEAGLATVEGSRMRLAPGALPLADMDVDSAMEILLQTLLEKRQPTWLRLSDECELADELIPTADVAAIERILPDPARREELLLRLARTFDSERNRSLGLLGEMAVLEECRSLLTSSGRADLAAQVAHVSPISDELGYDIVSPTTSGTIVRLEVKTTTASQLRVFLSRTESDVGLRDPGWALVVCCAKMDSTVYVAGWCRASVLEPALPQDACRAGRWASVRLNIQQQLLEPGLPL